jgi:tRNA(fMet)-specific endonuclease VapC
MRYMLDTNICIYLIKDNPPHVLQRLRVLKRGEAVMSVVTYAELRAGVEMQSATRSIEEREADHQALLALTTRIPVLPFTDSAAERYGVMRAASRDRNRDTMDRLISAHAASIGLVLVTNNEAGFMGYSGLAVENWALSPGPGTV